MKPHEKLEKDLKNRAVKPASQGGGPLRMLVPRMDKAREGFRAEQTALIFQYRQVKNGRILLACRIFLQTTELTVALASGCVNETTGQLPEKRPPAQQARNSHWPQWLVCDRKYWSNFSETRNFQLYFMVLGSHFQAKLLKEGFLKKLMISLLDEEICKWTCGNDPRIGFPAATFGQNILKPPILLHVWFVMPSWRSKQDPALFLDL